MHPWYGRYTCGNVLSHEPTGSFDIFLSEVWQCIVWMALLSFSSGSEQPKERSHYLARVASDENSVDNSATQNLAPLEMSVRLL